MCLPALSTADFSNGNSVYAPPKLAVGDALDPNLPLHRDDFTDRLIFHRRKVLLSTFAAIELFALREELLWTLERATVFGAEGGLELESGSRHGGRGERRGE